MRHPLVLLVLLALLGTGLSLATVGPFHHKTADCFLAPLGSLAPDCTENCDACHEQDGEPVDFLTADERWVCRCHFDPTLVSGDNSFLTHSLGTEHPSDTPYAPRSRPGSDLRPNPAGPKLFCRVAGECKVHCYTCHEVKSGKPMLLRMPNNRSRLCIACHDK